MLAKTLFVIGAGAGIDLRLPAGAELAKAIAPMVDFRYRQDELASGDRELASALWSYTKQKKLNINDFLHGGRTIAGGVSLADSIDSFLDSHRDNEAVKLCGKLAIVKSILEAERASRLYIDPRASGAYPLAFVQLDDTWMVKFFRMLSSGIAKDDIERLFEKISVITFNYDRCLEHFLTYAIAAKYSVSLTDAETLVERLEILHPYGSVGPAFRSGQPHAIPFGCETRDETTLLRLAQQIRIYTEQAESGEVTEKIRQLVADAEILVFLGFGFHRQNMDLLSPKKDSGKKRSWLHIYATALGLSESDCKIVEQQLGRIAHYLARERNIVLRNDLGCAELIHQYRRSIST